MGFRFPAFGWGASSWAFLVRWVSQPCAFLREGRQNSVNFPLSFDHVEVNILLIYKWLIHFLFSSGFRRLLDFFSIFGYYCEHCLLCGEDSSFVYPSLFYKRRVFICLLYLPPVCLLWVCWVRGNFLAGRVTYFLCICGSAVWSAGPVQFYSGTLLERMAGLYKFFCLSSSVVAGTVRLKWWRGWSFFLLLSSVCCHCSWRLDVCGRIFALYILNFSGGFAVLSCGFLFRKLLIFNNLLQVVSSQSELGRGPGASAWANASGASEGGPRDPHRPSGGRCEVSPKRLPVPERRGQEGRYVRHDLWLGQWNLPAEVWAGFREQPAVLLLDSSLNRSNVCLR